MDSYVIIFVRTTALLEFSSDSFESRNFELGIAARASSIASFFAVPVLATLSGFAYHWLLVVIVL